ncbi:hypothetical protein DB032_19535 [Chromobacterium sp. Panama]|uniref:TnsA endonuclease N-terminal domain-containing protein n=1 Tax=Chromobacterium sp. Panama TaxID=2161826 RepID=UPI000D315904|nr:TnsA endonuclease N-terminal domain-containing protein [Chromobacterium sp. Panama]PTU67907.1 hypothetical protein DB032_19535 [Chromobacterium sp. Panama]
MTKSVTNFASEHGRSAQALTMSKEGLDYEHWLTVRDVPSLGRKTRAAGHTVDREHHLLSDLETNFFLIADFAPNVIDIRTQFPLLPIEQTIQIAQDMGIRHPADRKTAKWTVMTTDFLLTHQDRKGYHHYHAYSIKPSSRLTEENRRRRTRTLEKLEIERRLWLSLNVPWTLVTEEAFDPIMITNLKWLSYGARDLTPELLFQLPRFLNCLAGLNHLELSLTQLLATSANQLHLDDQGCAQQLFCHSAWSHLLLVNLHQPISLSLPSSFRFSPLAQQIITNGYSPRNQPEYRRE